MSSVRLLRAVNRQQTSWKNGGGHTRVIATDPADADLETFDWRISTASVCADGPFSRFAGVDRQLAVLEGRLCLQVANRKTNELTRASPPVSFSGDDPTSACVLAGPVTDLNVMTRTGRFRSTLDRRSANSAVEIRTRAKSTVIVAVARLRLQHEGMEYALQELDAVLLAGCTRAVLTPILQSADYFFIELFRADKRIYVPGKPGDWPNLAPLIGGTLNIKLMEQQFDEVMRLTAADARLFWRG